MRRVFCRYVLHGCNTVGYYQKAISISRPSHWWGDKWMGPLPPTLSLSADVCPFSAVGTWAGPAGQEAACLPFIWLQEIRYYSLMLCLSSFYLLWYFPNFPRCSIRKFYIILSIQILYIKLIMLLKVLWNVCVSISIYLSIYLSIYRHSLEFL